MTRRPWSHAWNDALYGPAGFYRTQSPRRHFATSVNGVPGTVDVLADALAEFMHHHGLRNFVDLAAGQCDLVCAVAARDPEVCAIAMDIRPRLGSADGGRTHPGCTGQGKWLELPVGRATLTAMRAALADIDEALVWAHEWLDVVPCEIAELGPDRELHYVLYDIENGVEELGGHISEADLQWCRLHWSPVELDVGDRVEIGRERDLRWSQVTQSLGSGIAIAVDFGHTADRRPRRGTLTGYRDGRAVPAVPDGTCDLSAAVAMDSLGAPVLLEQRLVLAGLGVAAGPPDPAMATAQPQAYLAALTRCAASASLLGPGYGDTLWAIAPAGRRGRG